MSADPYCEHEWDDLCRRVQWCVDYCARHAPEFAESLRFEATEFEKQPPPERYADLLDRVREAAALAKAWRDRSGVGSGRNADTRDAALPAGG